MSSSRYAKKAGGKAHVADESGDAAQIMIELEQGRVQARKLVSDDAEQIKKVLGEALKNEHLDVVLFTGGTGISSTDVTIETVAPFFDKEITGFGELFRVISYQRIGAAAALSRATAGVAHGKVVLCLPGSPDAVKTALEIFITEMPHFVFLAKGR